MTSVSYYACTAWLPEIFGSSAYGYRPSLPAAIVYCILFGLSMLVHVYQAVRTKAYWNLVFAVGALTELLGWAARAWSYECPYNINAFLMQICTLIIAPTFYTAGIYVILGRMIQIAGRKTSPISPVWYLWIFCTIDVISLVIQAVGGGMAAVAFQSTPPGNTATGTNIMVAGIDFQLASVLIFSVLFCVVVYRAIFRLALPAFQEKDMKLLVSVTTFSILLIIMRSIYRTVELAEGWTGYVIETQRYFIALDGAPMVAVVVAFNILHPGQLLNRISSRYNGHLEEPQDEELQSPTSHEDKVRGDF